MGKIFSICGIILLVGCATQSLIYDISLVEVEMPASVKERYGELKIERIEEEGISKYLFQNDAFQIFWIVTGELLLFELTNKTSYTIKIIWDEGAYVDENGKSHNIVESKIRFRDIGRPQVPSVIPGKASLKGAILPSDYISSPEEIRPLFKLFPDLYPTGRKELIEEQKEIIGKTIKLLLPIQIEEVVNEYIFIFKINDIK